MAQVSITVYQKFFNLLMKCPIGKLEKLTHHLIDLYCNQKATSYEEYSAVWTLDEWWELVQESESFLRFRTSDEEECPGISTLPEDFQKVLQDVFIVRDIDLKNRLIEKTNEVSPAYLKDFDWKLKLVLASDKMAQINEHRLLLNLDVGGDKNESLTLDLSKDELKSLIDSMEKANKAMQEFSINE